MTKEERFQKARELAHKLNAVNDLDYAYTEADEDFVRDSVRNITGKIPKLWERKTHNRQQCYSIMFSKLFLAYLISEIKNGNFLPIEYLETIKDCPLENFYKFYWDDEGYNVAYVLENMIEKIITKDDIFQISEEIMDTSAVGEAEYLYRNGEEDGSCMEDAADPAMADCILETCPKLCKVTDKAELVRSMPPITYYLEYDYELETWMVEISSSILYDIIKREEKFPTELGKSIVERYEDVLKYTLMGDDLYWGLYWTLVDEEDKVLRFYEVTGSDVFGDDCIYPTFSMDRLYKYRFSAIFDHIELQSLIKQYRKMYLNG